MKFEFDIDIASGSWSPGHDILEMIKSAFKLRHEHSNKDVIDKITAVESEIKEDSDNPVSSAAVSEVTKKIHTHNNKDLLDSFAEDEDGNLLFNNHGIGQRRTDSEIFTYFIENSTEEFFFICDYDLKISGKEIAKIELLDIEGNWIDADRLCSQDIIDPSIRINKYVEHYEELGVDILGFYATLRPGRAGWFVKNFTKVRVTYYV